MKIDKVSIIMASFNSEKYIVKALESIINQSYKDWECIIIDDFSDDNSVKIIKNCIRSDKRFYMYSNKKNIGAGQSRNIGISIAEGQFLTFLDSDDIWEPHHLERQILFMKSNKLTISHSHYGYINSKGDKLKEIFKVSLKKIGFKDLLLRPEMSCLTTIIDISKTGKFYMSEDKRRQDYYLWLNLLKNGNFSRGFDHIGGYYRQHDNQPKKNLKYLYAHFHFLRSRIKLSLIDSFKYTLSYSIRGIFKYLHN